MDHIGFSSALYCSDRSVFNWNQTFMFSNGKKRPILQCRRYILFDFLIIFLFPLYVSVIPPSTSLCTSYFPVSTNQTTHTHQQPSKFSLPESEPEPHSLKSFEEKHASSHPRHHKQTHNTHMNTSLPQFLFL